MNKPIRRPPEKPNSTFSKIAKRAAVAILVLAIVYWLRPVFYPFAIRFYVEPLVWVLPLLIFLVGVAVSVRNHRRGPKVDPLGFPPPKLSEKLAQSENLNDVVRAVGGTSSPILIASALAFMTFLVMGILSGPLVAKEIYANTTYTTIRTLPPSGSVRITPKEVAERVAGSGFNSATETLTDFHLIRRNDALAWTALRTPDGAFRALTQNTVGTLELNASSSSRDTTQADGTFETAPGMLITDNLTWRLRKANYFAELDDAIALTDSAGKPLIAVSYIKYKGFLVRRPVFGGVFIVHPDGKIEDLSPEEAARRKELVAAGRIYPEKLARREQDAYAYKGGLLNKWFIHEEQTQISSTESNPQPYLLDFGKLGLKYVTAAEPYGRAFAVNAIFLTDSVTGETQIWRPPNKADLTGNRRVLETVRSLSIPGIEFAETSTNAPNDRGGFRVVEPRPMVVRGRLVFMTSIVPDNANNVSKTVFIDAATNRTAAIFNNDSDDRVDQKIAAYINGGAPSGTVNPERGSGDQSGATGATGDQGPTAQSDGSARERVDELLERQRELIDELEQLRDQLPE
ncbi:MAG: hypothetical protein JHD02_00835 [Thermoleophilaceae bacterium]|nr:hypothetical protein [Thermoleophilaceae bacterium]